MEDLYRSIRLQEAGTAERHISYLRQMIVQHERLMVSRELAGIRSSEISWQIRRAYLSTLSMCVILADELGIAIVAESP
jgi:hypothetical protein